MPGKDRTKLCRGLDLGFNFDRLGQLSARGEGDLPLPKLLKSAILATKPTGKLAIVG